MTQAGISTIIHRRHPRGDRSYCGVRGAARLTDHRDHATCLRCRGKGGWQAPKRRPGSHTSRVFPGVAAPQAADCIGRLTSLCYMHDADDVCICQDLDLTILSRNSSGFTPQMPICMLYGTREVRVPTIFSQGSIKYRIYPGDHNPPHVHAVMGDREAMIELSTGIVLKNNGFPERGSQRHRGHGPRAASRIHGSLGDLQ